MLCQYMTPCCLFFIMIGWLIYLPSHKINPFIFHFSVLKTFQFLATSQTHVFWRMIFFFFFFCGRHDWESYILLQQRGMNSRWLCVIKLFSKQSLTESLISLWFIILNAIQIPAANKLVICHIWNQIKRNLYKTISHQD